MSEDEAKCAVSRTQNYQNNTETHNKVQSICMRKHNKKENKNYSRNNVILSLWSRSVGIYDFRVDTQVDTL